MQRVRAPALLIVSPFTYEKNKRSMSIYACIDLSLEGQSML